MFPEPLLLKDRAAVAVDDINKRIQLKERLHIIVRQHLDIPHDGRRPHANLQRDTDYLL